MPSRYHPRPMPASIRRALAAGLATAALVTGLAPAARADDQFALGMFHFNVQYVAGGMVGYYAVPNPGIDLDAEQIEDLIVTESFAPVLELYAKRSPAASPRRRRSTRPAGPGPRGTACGSTG